MDNTILLLAKNLGNPQFKKIYRLNYAYLTGSMYRGIASKELVIRMGDSGLMGFLGAGGLSLTELEQQILYIKSNLSPTANFGVNLLCAYSNNAQELAVVELLLRHKVRFIEASAFVTITKSLVRYRLTGIYKDNNNVIQCPNRILAKLSRPEVAYAFLSPPPQKIVDALLAEGRITPEQATLSQSIPMCNEICVEADSGGHTDMGVSTVLTPIIMKIKNEMAAKYYHQPIYLGMAGGIGSPEAAASAFLMGADFIVTGSINQCTVESGTSDHAKSLLQNINYMDTAYAPAGDMFELGSRIQVLKKGTLFALRANKLFSLYNHYNALDELPGDLCRKLENDYFKMTLQQVWENVRQYFMSILQFDEIKKAESLPRYKMVLVFKYYFYYSAKIALTGQSDDFNNYQIHTGPALGAFNQWVQGTELEPWKNRHVDIIAEKLMYETANFLMQRMNSLQNITSNNVLPYAVNAVYN
jgi:trans-AT polyketide synthase/acyltransferase/oxidoreductase domain-containing protein